jgi:hypothetical protein
VTERVHLRRRASDRADERAARAQRLGDLIGMWVATGQADEARRRRAEWEEGDEHRPDPPDDVTTDVPVVPALRGRDS